MKLYLWELRILICFTIVSIHIAFIPNIEGRRRGITHQCNTALTRQYPVISTTVDSVHTFSVLKSTKHERHGDSYTNRRKFICSTTASAIAGATTGIIATTLLETEPAAAVNAVQEIVSSSEKTSAGPLAYPFASQRQYRHLTLANGLRVVLVSDKKNLREGASLSIGGAGQFAESSDVPGLAHLMEHMCLSSTPKLKSQTAEDFEEWLSDRNGASNGFTGADSVNFEFNADFESFQEALLRFSCLFLQESVESVCQDDSILRREIRRVDSELDFSSDASRAFYLLKDRTRSEHPFSRFSAGSLETLEKKPKEDGIDVGSRLFEFFKKYYVTEKAVLVVVGSGDLATLQRWVAPFASILSKEKATLILPPPTFPEPFRSRTKLSQVVLLRSSNRDIPKLSLEWPLDLEYNDALKTSSSNVITASAVGFVLSQILGRRGPTSLCRYLRQKGWNYDGLQGIPRISFPVDVSGFQILKLEIGLTVEGFANRYSVVAAVIDSINAVLPICPPSQPFLLPRKLICQYITIAYLNGYLLAPRAPVAIELAVDAQTYGVDEPNGVGVTGVWPLMPKVQDTVMVDNLTRIVANTLKVMSRSSRALATIVVAPKVIFNSRSLGLETLPPLASKKWQEEPITGAKYIEEDIFSYEKLVKNLVAVKLDKIEFGPPTLNPLVPSVLRPIRSTLQPRTSTAVGRYYFVDDSYGPAKDVWRNYIGQPNKNRSEIQSSEHGQIGTTSREDWKLWQLAGITKLPVSNIAAEASCCAFVIQLISDRPARATNVEAAHAELWRLSFENAIIDLAELGIPGALSYEVSFNNFGIRICFQGLSATLPSYTRRFCKRFVKYHSRLIDGSEELLPSVVDKAVFQAKRRLNGLQKRQTISVICDSNAKNAGREGQLFFESTSRVACLVQGDFLPDEAIGLMDELQKIFHGYIYLDRSKPVMLPELKDLLYKPQFKPSSGSSCFIAGAYLISDACGRVIK